MKVFLKYEDNENADLHKTLKITLPKSWKQGPTSKVLKQFVESYNASPTISHELKTEEMHLAIVEEGSSDLIPLASDAISIEVIPDRSDVFVCHGPSQTMEEREAQEEASKKANDKTVNCKRFGCKKRFPRGGPYPKKCVYHRLPPVFHETAKYWACCPDKKAYDWNDFENIPGCMDADVCTEVKEDGKQFLGGSDLREEANGPKLKSIDDFNTTNAGGVPVMERLRGVLAELDVENELFDQVVDCIKQDIEKNGSTENEQDLNVAVTKELASKLKKAMKAIAVDHLRIK